MDSMDSVYSMKEGKTEMDEMKPKLEVLIEELKMDVSNESIGEIICFVPYLLSSIENFVIYNGNILLDIKKTYFDLYDSLINLEINRNIKNLVNDELKYLKAFL